MENVLRATVITLCVVGVLFVVNTAKASLTETSRVYELIAKKETFGVLFCDFSLEACKEALKEVTDYMPRMEIVAIDVTRWSEFADKFEVTEYPALYGFDKGELIAVFTREGAIER